MTVKKLAVFFICVIIACCSCLGCGNDKPENNGTDINKALEYLTSAIKKRCTSFLISDFIDDKDYQKAMSITNSKHDLIAIQVYDKRDVQMPDVGLVKAYDTESGAEKWINTSSAKVRQAYNRWWYVRQQKMTEMLQRSQVDLASVATDEDYVKALMGLFKRRGVSR